MSVGERIWRSRTQSYVRLFAPRIGVSQRGCSRRLERVLSDFGCEDSFARASQRVAEHYGFEINATALRQATLKSAARAQEQLEQQYQQSYRSLPADGPEFVIAQVDGSMICTVESAKRKAKRPRACKEMRLTVAQAHESTQSCYGATFGSVDEVGRRWGHCARAAGRGLNTQVHALGDGAEWIAIQCQEVFGQKGQFLCDFYHVSEYVAAAAQSSGAKSPERWRRTQQSRLRSGKSSKVIKELEKNLEPPTVADEQAPVRCAHRYLSNRTEALDYPGALEQGLPIGSGLIESGHRHVLQARLKKSGAAWLVENAERLAQLRVLRTNGQWESIWN